MELDEETQHKIRELQMTEQNAQNFSLQKQAFQIELDEASSSLEETKKASGDIFKITGQIMIRANREEIIKELEEKQEILSLRIKSIEKQEKLFIEKLEKLREEIENKLKNKKK